MLDATLPRLPPAPCALDLECPSPTLCIDGGCAADPYAPPGCATHVPCPMPLTCGLDGICGCHADDHCPPGFACASHGACLPDTDLDACAADADCADDMLCLGGRCVARGDCAAGDAAPFAGRHRLVFHLPIREALPDPARALLEAVAAPFRVLAGDGLVLDLGLPAFVERLVAQLARAWAERHLEPWHRALLGLFADADDLLDGWRIEEDVTLEAEPEPWIGAAVGTEVVRRLALRSEERDLVGTPEAVLGTALALPAPRVAAACGRAVVAAREMDVPLGALVVWLADRLVEEATDGRHETVDAALSALSADFCDGLADDVGGAIGLGVGPVLGAACQAELDRLRAAELAAVREASFGVTPIALRGSATLVGPAREGRTEALVAGRLLEGRFALAPVDD